MDDKELNRAISRARSLNRGFIMGKKIILTATIIGAGYQIKRFPRKRILWHALRGKPIMYRIRVESGTVKATDSTLIQDCFFTGTTTAVKWQPNE